MRLPIQKRKSMLSHCQVAKCCSQLRPFQVYQDQCGAPMPQPRCSFALFLAAACLATASGEDPARVCCRPDGAGIPLYKDPWSVCEPRTGSSRFERPHVAASPGRAVAAQSILGILLLS